MVQTSACEALRRENMEYKLKYAENVDAQTVIQLMNAANKFTMSLNDISGRSATILELFRTEFSKSGNSYGDSIEPMQATQAYPVNTVDTADVVAR